MKKEVFPLNHAQKRIYLVEYMNPGTTMWNLPRTLWFTSRYPFDVVRSAVEHIQKTEKTVSIRILSDKGFPCQTYSDEPIEIEYISFRNTGGEGAYLNWVGEESDKPFDMIQGGALSRFVIAEITPGQHVVYFNIHHIICDGTSLSLLSARLYEAVVAIASGNPPPAPLSPDAISFTGHEEAYLASPDYLKDHDFWNRITESIPEPLDLAYVHSENTGKKRQMFQLPPDLCTAIYSFCASQKTSPYRLFVTAFSLYCTRITGNEEVVIGTAFANRYPEMMADAIGMFVASTPLFITCRPGSSIQNHLASVTHTIKEAQVHARYPYDTLITDIRDRTGEEYQFLNYTLVQDVPADLGPDARLLFHSSKESENDITIFCRTGRSEKVVPIELNVLYNPSVFSDVRIEEMVGHLETILWQCCRHSDITISDISYLSPAEETRLFQEFNATSSTFPETTVHDLIHTRATRNPDAIALVYNNMKYSYQEVDRMSSSLAEKLVSEGAGRDTFIAILADRSPLLIIAQLAILKAGAVILPIDPAYPPERIRYILHDSSCQVILSSPRFISFMEENLIQVRTVIDIFSEENFLGSETGYISRGTQSDCAILLYTSGSTGNPKGVQLNHCSLVNFCTWFIRYVRLTDQDHMAKHASFSFDSSILEIFPTLMSGATLHIIDDDIRFSLKHLNEYYEEHGITIGFFTTQFGEQFIEFVQNNSLRVLILGGEKLRYYQKRNYTLINGYGPTECTVFATVFTVDKSYENIPIGYPLDNARIYILDRWNHLQPIGAAGELCIAGVSLAQGYLNLPEKTGQVFIDNPVCPGERLYRTGDLAAWTHEGYLLHLGRMDRQVKIRGFRIEIGEIERALLDLPGISEAAVLDGRDNAGRIFLCGYYVTEEPLEPDTIRHHLKKTLPDFMVPAYLVPLQSLPINPNGKIDRKRLPKPEETKIVKTYISPETEEEREIAGIFEDVLRVGSVGATDDFFSLGGDSIKAVLVIAQLEDRFSCDIPMRGFFQAKTPRNISALLQEKKKISLPPVSPAPPAPYYPVTESQRQLFMLDTIPTIGPTYTIPLVIEIRGEIDKKRLADALILLVKRHEALMTRFYVQDGEPVQVIDAKTRVKLIYEEISDEDAREAMQSFFTSFDLRTAPLFLVKLIQSAPDKRYLLIDLHHIIADGMSVSVILHDLSLLYAQKELEPPAFQFKDYAVWIQDLEKQGLLEGNVSFWTRYLKEYQPVEFITDNPHQNVPDFIGASREFILDKETTQALSFLVETTDTTLHVVLMGIISLLYAKYTQQDDVVIGTSTNGRGPAGSESVVGMFVETIPVRSRFIPGQTFLTYLHGLRDTLFDLYDHQPFPHSRVFDVVAENRGVGRHPFIDLNVVLQNQEEGTFTADGINSTVSYFDLSRVKFDISITIREGKENLHFRIEYRQALFYEDTIRYFELHLLSLMRSVVQDPGRSIDEYTIIDEEERHFLLTTINNTSTPLPDYPTVAGAIEKICAHYPDTAAITAPDGTITYHELDLLSAGIAREITALLLSSPKEEEQIIGIIAERSYLTVAAMVGALRAGVAYVAIDPAYPPDRISFIINDTRAALLAGRDPARDRIGEIYQGIFLSLDESSLKKAGNPDFSQVITPSPHDLAYIIFTSGSTGTPKGVMIEHRSMVNFITWYVRQHQIGPKSRCGEFASFTFDVSVVQIFAPLCAGAHLHIIPEDLRISPHDLDRYFELHGITHAHFPTQFAEHFMQITKNRSLKRLVVGGDRLQKYTIGSYQLVNEYGPSETTMASTSIEIEKVVPRPSIGRPIANTRVYVLDQKRNLVPVGIPGELYIAGEGVARGYLHQPQLTAEKFLQSPFIPGERMFKTGDRVRVLADGTLEFIGRMDFQVKIRGYRIEPGEIESVMRNIPGIKNAVVLAWDDGGGKYLCGYYESGEPIRESELKAFLRNHLPEYMIPLRFVHQERFVLNRNGKVDRKALKSPDITHESCKPMVEPPRNSTEHLIASIWERVLNRSCISIFDDFFETGGDSLRAISLLVELEKHFNVTISDIFSFRTIADQAVHLKPSQSRFSDRIVQLRDLVRPAGDDEPCRNEKDAYLMSVNQIAWDTFDMSLKCGYQTILLTGSTGTLGRYLLRDLLLMTQYSVVLIVRGSDDADAKKRVMKGIQETFGDNLLLQYPDRVTVFAGDLTSENLGLSESTYAGLAGSVDAIIHSAALTKHIGDYEDFYQANVISTKLLLQLCSVDKQKDFFYISTISVAGGLITGKKAIFFSEDSLDLGQQIDNPYIKSKFEAEKLIRAAIADGIRATVFRAGNITFDSESGAYQHNVEENAFFQQVRAYVNIGLVPDEHDQRNLSYVNETSRHIVSLFDYQAILTDPRFHTVHLVNPHVAHLSTLLCDPVLDLRMQMVPFPEFIDALADLYPYKGFSEYIDRLLLHLGWRDLLEGASYTSFCVEYERSMRLLAFLGLSWSVPQPEMMTRFVTRALADRVRFLASTSLGTSGEEQLVRLARLIVPMAKCSGTLIQEENRPVTDLSLLVGGFAEVYKHTADGWIGTIQLYGPGDISGEESIAQNNAYTTIEAFDDLVVYTIAARDFIACMRDEPTIALVFIGIMSEKIKRLDSLLIAFGTG